MRVRCGRTAFGFGAISQAALEVVGRSIETFGADMSGATAADEAWNEAVDWQQEAPRVRSIRIPNGYLWLAAEHSLEYDNLQIEGNGLTSVILLSQGPGSDAFTSGAGYAKWLKFRGVRFAPKDPDAVPCRYVFAMPATTADGGWKYHDVQVWGDTCGWTAMLGMSGATSDTTLSGGTGHISALMEGRASFRQIPPTGPALLPGYVVHAFGSVLAVAELDVYGWQCQESMVHFENPTDYPRFGTAKITGGGGDNNRDLHIFGGQNYVFEQFSTEGQVQPSVIEQCAYDLRDSQFGTVDEVGTARALSVRSASVVATKTGSYGNVIILPSQPVPRTTMADSQVGNGQWLGNLETRREGAAFGFADPPNVLLNGDLARLVDGDLVHNVWGHYGAWGHAATICGAGRADTTRTLATETCALLRALPGGDWWFLDLLVAATLPGQYLDCLVNASLKFKALTPGSDAPLVGFTAPSELGSGQPSVDGYGCPMLSENGFTHAAVARRVSAEMLTEGLILRVMAGAPHYLSEIAVTFGDCVPRNFVRAERSPFFPAATLDERGTLVLSATEKPTGVVDPVMGAPWQTEDRVVIVNPPIETAGTQAFRTLAWWFDGAAWRDESVLTGMVAS